MRLSKEIPTAESAPALPSTPVVNSMDDVSQGSALEAHPETYLVKRKFAKTLRLTSDQLVRPVVLVV
jgi:phosphatidate phosphatase LPIN